MNPPQRAGLIHVREAPFGQLTAHFLQPLATRSSYPPAVGVHPLLFDPFAFPLPVPSSALRFRDVAPDRLAMEFFQYRSAVESLVGDHLLHASFIALARRRLRLLQRLLDGPR